MNAPASIPPPARPRVYAAADRPGVVVARSLLARTARVLFPGGEIVLDPEAAAIVYAGLGAFLADREAP